MTAPEHDDLGACPLFAGLEAAELAAVAAGAVERRLRPRELLFLQGDPALELGIVVAGRLKLNQIGADGQELIVRYVGPGEICALVALFADQLYPVSAEAVVATRVRCWPQPALERLMLEHPRVALNALRIQSERMQEITERLREVTTERVAQRVARSLLRLARKAGRRSEQGVEIDMPLSREDLARLAGTTVFTVSRLMADWEAAGLVAGGRERVVIRYPHGLVAIAEDLAARQRDEPEAGPRGRED
jgi:CRP-like cAMP-binding protein